MRRLTYLLAFALTLPFFANAQSNEREANFQFKQANYALAYRLYNDIYKKDTNNVDVNYYLGACRICAGAAPHLALNNLLKAADKYGSKTDFQLLLAYAYLYNYKFDEARKACDLAKDAKNMDGRPEDAVLLKKKIDNAERMIKTPLNVSFVNLGKGINSELNEETPMLSANDEMLLYTTNRKYDNVIKMYTYDVLFSPSDMGDYKKNRPAAAINSQDDEFLAGISRSGSHVFFQLQGVDAFQDLLATETNGINMKGKLMLPEPLNSKSAETAICESASGDTMIFSSDRAGGFGCRDLYMSIKLPTGNYGEPINLGKNINTKYNEDFPMLSADGKQLFFCSDGEESMGGFDIFVSDINPETGELGKPRNIGYPLNDVFDNKTIAYSLDGRYAYVSAIRPDSYGFADLYRVIFNDKDPSVKIYRVKMKQGTGETATDFADTDSSIKAVVYNAKTKTVFGTYNYNAANSQFTIALPPGNYTLEVKGDKIQDYSTKVNVSSAPGKKIENLNCSLVVK